MKNTALTAIHEKLGAKMVLFAGYNMPVQYEGVIAEHNNVREHVGVFDVSHMGEFWVRGPQALDLVQRVTSNDASKLIPGKIQYSCLPNDQGGIVDDLLVYCVDSENFLLVVNASNIEKDWNWISSHNTFDCRMENASDEISLLAVQGPRAVAALQSLTDIDLEGMAYYTFEYGTFAGIENVLVSATGYTGAGGFEIYIPNHAAEEIWNAIFAAGADQHIRAIGLAARDTLRLEMGFCLYGNDIDDTTSPIEAGLGWITKFTKDFIHSDQLRAQKEAGVEKKLVGFKMIDKGIPRHDYSIADSQGREIGRVTSGTMSPSLQEPIGMGYVPAGMAAPGTVICIRVRNRDLKAEVVKLPFYKG